MRVGILETGILEQSFSEAHGGFPDMFKTWLGPHLPDPAFQCYEVINDIWPKGPEACDAWLITGSRFGVYDPEPWIEPLKTLIQQIVAARRPLLGICFGHQIIAEALGGKAVKSDRGWGAGIQHYRISRDGAETTYPLLVSHQDQVVELAPGSKVIGGTEHCPMGVIAYDAPVLTAQFHPEFQPALSAAIIRFRAGVSIPEDLAAEALESLDVLPENNAMGAWMGGWMADRVADQGDR